MKFLYALILVLLAGAAYGQSNLPACQGSDSSRWDNCFGSWTYSSGNKYVGEWKDGKRNGQGNFFFLADDEFKGDKYVGEYKDGVRSGQGAYTWSDGSKYLGDLMDNTLNGQGIYTYADGVKYVGEFKDGKKNGQGTVTWATGEKYIGEWKDDKINGRGITYSAIGSIKNSGIYKDNALVTSQYIDPNSFTRIARNNTGAVVSDSQRQAIEQREKQVAIETGQSKLPACEGSDPRNWSYCFGTYTQAQGVWKGDKFVGEFGALGVFHGKGTYFHLAENQWKGDKFVGEYVNGKRRGEGTYYYLADNQFKGDMYVGEFKDGYSNGQGTYYYLANNQFKGDKYVGEFMDGKFIGQGTYYYLANNQFKGDKYVGEWKDGKRNGQGITYSANGGIKQSGIYKDNLLVTSQYIDPNSFTRIARNNSAPAVSDSQRQAIEQRERQIELESQRVAEERRRLEEDKRQRELAKQSKRISINASATQPDSTGVVTINIQTNTDTSSLKINGEELGGKADGNYSVRRVARVGQETKFILAATDVYGNTDTKSITVSRSVVESKVTYQQLNPDRIKRQPERDAVAIIIGISNYKSLPRAEFAKDDAQVFYDYAIRALGVKPGNIKLLMDEQADAEEIYTAFKTWLPARVKSTTDVYVFYSGHGLPTQDGSGLYWLPQRANRDVIAKTAILLQDINIDIQASKPKSVTIFMDACYSGQARGGETLIASARPIALKSQPTTFPSNFTVISASQADQISSSSPELQHGIFSYYLMRGMEGEADLNRDAKITLDEIQSYLSENVGRQARIMNRQQEPQVIGDGSKVLVGR
jgi:hypothetical protein